MPTVPPHLADGIQLRIDALSTGGGDGWLRRVCKERLNALPLAVDEIYLWALRPDGTLLCMDHDAFALPVHEERDPAVLCSVLRNGALHYPELAELAPPSAGRAEGTRNDVPPAAPEGQAPADAGRRELLQVLRDTRAMLARPENEFAWSSWPDAEAALAELDTVAEAVRAGRGPASLAASILFAPTGPVQQTALRSGWGDAFLVLARRFDAAVDRMRAAPAG